GRNAELAQNLGRLAAGDARERFVYAWGAPGCGRSHLLKGTVMAMHRAGRSAACLACAPGTPMPDGAERMDCVALDDVDLLDHDGQVAAFHLYNALRERGGALVAAGAAPPV